MPLQKAGLFSSCNLWGFYDLGVTKWCSAAKKWLGWTDTFAQPACLQAEYR
jgi:hypothetical protein